jgi:hypothetical protein
MFEKILAPVDGKDISESIMQYVAASGGKLEAILEGHAGTLVRAHVPV